MRKRSFLTGVASTFILSGCVTINQGFVEDRQLHEEYLSQIHLKYQGQLLDVDKSHATLIGFPYRGFDGLSTTGFVPTKIDTDSVKHLTHLKDELPHPVGWFNRPHYGLSTPDQSLLPLRIKPGFYNVVVWGGARTPKQTFIPNVKIEAGKSYLIYPETVSESRLMSIHEYKIDQKFKPTESEYYLVGKMVSDKVVYGYAK